jgi:cell division protein FtsI/penicillin-binding protein 2
MEIVDKVYKIGSAIHVGYTKEGKPIPQLYKGGRLPRSHLYNLGKMDLLNAFEHSSNPYFSLLAGDFLEKPEDLAKAARLFSYGRKTGLELPGEISGRVPTDLETNRTGLYATAIGQHTLVVTPLQTTVMLSALANGGKVLKPQIVSLKVGKSLADMQPVSPLVLQNVFMPEMIRNMLLEGMRRVVLRTQGESLWTLSRIYSEHPDAIADYIDLKHQLVGKTSTSEAIERLDIDSGHEAELYKHVWFGGVSFDEEFVETFGKPEVVVVVYLRFGGYGKEAAPIASQIVRKWREIKKKQSK